MTPKSTSSEKYKEKTITEASSSNANIDSAVKQSTCAFCRSNHYFDRCRCTKYATGKEQESALPEVFCILCLGKHRKKECRTPQKLCFCCRRANAHNSALRRKRLGYFSDRTEKNKETENQDQGIKVVNLIYNEKGTYLTASLRYLSRNQGKDSSREIHHSTFDFIIVSHWFQSTFTTRRPFCFQRSRIPACWTSTFCNSSSSIGYTGFRRHNRRNQ